MHAGVVQSNYVIGSARGGTASSSGRSWAHACLSGAGRSCYSGPCRQLDTRSWPPARQHPAACSLRARDVAHPAAALHKLSSDCRCGAFERNSNKHRNQQSRARHHAACAGAGAGVRLGGTWQPQHPGPGDRGPSGRQLLLISSHCLRPTKWCAMVEAWSILLCGSTNWGGNAQPLMCRHGAAWWTWLTLRLPLLGSPQLLQRIALTILFLALARLGMFIPLPGVGLSKAAGGYRTQLSPQHH